MTGITRREILRGGVKLAEGGVLAGIGGGLKPPKEPTKKAAEKAATVPETPETPAIEKGPKHFWTITARDVMPVKSEILGPMEPLEQIHIGGQPWAVAYERSREKRGLYITPLVKGHEGVEPIALNLMEKADWVSILAVNTQPKTGDPNTTVVSVITEQLVKGEDGFYDWQYSVGLSEVDGRTGGVGRRKRVILTEDVTGVSPDGSSGLTSEMLVELAKDGIKATDVKIAPESHRAAWAEAEAGTKSMREFKVRIWCDGEKRLLVAHSGKTYECTSIKWDNPEQEEFIEMRDIRHRYASGFPGSAFAFEPDGMLYTYTNNNLVKVKPGPIYDLPEPLPNSDISDLGYVMEMIPTDYGFVVIGQEGSQIKVWRYGMAERGFTQKKTIEGIMYGKPHTGIKLEGEKLVMPGQGKVIVMDLGKEEFTRYPARGMKTVGLSEGAEISVIMPQSDPTNPKAGNNPELWGLSPIGSRGYIPRASQFNDGETN